MKGRFKASGPRVLFYETPGSSYQVAAVACGPGAEHGALRIAEAMNREHLMREMAGGDMTAFPSMEAKAIEIADWISEAAPSFAPGPERVLEWLSSLATAGMADLIRG